MVGGSLPHLKQRGSWTSDHNVIYDIVYHLKISIRLRICEDLPTKYKFL
jgi:hypothetical protein